MNNTNLLPMKNLQKNDLPNDVAKWLVKYMICLYAALYALHIFATMQHQEPQMLMVPFESDNMYMTNIHCVA